jgi:hypothetical protein
MEKTLKYSVHVYGELEEAIECPLGTYCVDLKNHMFFFKSAKKEIPYHVVVKTAEAMANIAVAKHAKSAVPALLIHEECALLNEDDVQEKDGKLIYDFRVEGEMQEYVETKFGSLYADSKVEVFYFDSAKKGFMEPILKKKFYESIKADLNSEDSEEQLGADCVMNIIKDWTELDDDDIVREKHCN